MQWQREVRGHRAVMAPLKGPARTSQLAMMAPLVAPRGGLLPLLAILLVLLGGAGGSGGCPPQCKCLWRWVKQQCFKSMLIELWHKLMGISDSWGNYCLWVVREKPSDKVNNLRCAQFDKHASDQRNTTLQNAKVFFSVHISFPCAS